MPSRESTHFLPLASRIFHSRSVQDLSSYSQNTSSNFYNAAAHSATETALPLVREEEDSITALPAPERQAKRKPSFWNRRTQDQPAVLKKPAPTVNTTVLSSPKEKTDAEKAPKASKAIWKRFVTKAKAPFRRLKFVRKPKGSGKVQPIMISSPSNFQHLRTYGGQPLFQAESGYSLGGPEDEESESEAGMGTEGEWEDVE